MNPCIQQLPYKDPCELLIHFQKAGLTDLTLLDSSNSLQHSSAKYSILCANPIKKNKLRSDNRQKITATIESLSSLIPAFTGPLPFYGGTICALSYPDANGKIDLITHLYSWAFIFDHSCKITTLVHWPEISMDSQAKLISLYTSKPEISEFTPNSDTIEFHPRWSKNDYTLAFNDIKNYIISGDTYQINLTQQFIAKLPKEFNPLKKFSQLSQLAKAPFSAYFESSETILMSASPERFIEISQGTIRTQPIKGTRKRHQNPELDQSAINELKTSLKDRAENLMIVDLLRNDLGISSETGSVQVDALFDIESFGTVHHLVSTISSKLRHDTSSTTAFINAFPGGSITGTPKKRAMEIINEVENSNRGFYCGCLMYQSGNRLDSNILIRTFEINKKNKTIQVWGGGGIVADSELDSEYQESLDKISRLIDSIRD